MRRRTQYDIDSDQRIQAVQYALHTLDLDADGKIKPESERYSYADLVAALLSPEVVGNVEFEAAWVDTIQATLHEAIHADGVTAGEALVGLGELLRSAGNKIVRDERAAKFEEEP